ncbi:MAG: hypothetical protein A3I29_03615 [Candidatus Magasanikbacteria bacterium RIFCSPLOWO2_02_FULL_44_11]|uniref:DUF3048 domain-containing protein n=1 Tax=Candidatus Magasanikbacteria bacterium RIFCSPLOWO2_02_FULL_44_11 TaxID=1798689 RepID=A0A1F6NB61_9BACT|nr:MAG: hypothetical protein A3I29_03615 [Candidatus Magasanikbacteria bacterium RIFCSPLOWO2_02_FULL_44_11]
MKNGKKKIRLALALVFVLVVAAVVGYFIFIRKNEGTPLGQVTQAEPIKFYSQLDGTVVAEAGQVPRVVGVMVDNHPDARPQQAGLSKASIVYEALAEGGITRYLAIFTASSSVEKVGPVRSARPYYLDWIREYGESPYMHCGGSPEALSLISRLGLFSLNEFVYSDYYWRDNKYYVPHNLFTNSSLWEKVLAKQGAQRPTKEWSGWLFEKTPSTSTSSVSAATIRYDSYYKVGWKYDGKQYVRTINGVGHLDAGAPITADTIIIQEVGTKVIDDVGRKELDTIGAGDLRVLKHGTMVRGIWKKESVTGRTKFFDQAGQEIPLAAGHIWVEVVPVKTPVEITS